MDTSRRVREAVYGAIVASGRAPAIAEIAAAAGIGLEECRAALQALFDAHVLVMHPDGETVRYAAPFAGGETAFRVRSGQAGWYAPCAWDAFGIPAALHADAEIDTRCAHSGVPLPCAVRHGRAYGNAVVHMLVPAARFWDHIVHT